MGLKNYRLRNLRILEFICEEFYEKFFRALTVNCDKINIHILTV